MEGGEIYVKKCKSMKIADIACAIAPKAKYKIIGIRPGEKLNEQMIGVDDSYSTYEYPFYYKILPQLYEWGKDKLRIKNGKKVPGGFVYSSETNHEWMTKIELQKWININKYNILKV
jgi:FlaA1/EpsC-like NDP-sugar epimerase